jgi:hypothetical protein
MGTVIINAHDAFKRLVGSEFSGQQAEGIIKVIESISLDHVATSQDLKELEWRLVNKIILTNLGTVVATVTILRYLGGVGG